MNSTSSTWQEFEPNGGNNRNCAEVHESGIAHRIHVRFERLIRHQQRLLELRQEQQQLQQELAEIRRRTTTPQQNKL